MTYLGSETSRAEVTIYRHGNAASGQPAVTLRGRRTDDFEEPVLVSLNVNKILGAASGTFSFTFKFRGEENGWHIEDDDWVDIVLTRHDDRWHVMRGLVDDVRVVERVESSGATDFTVTVVGRDFGKIFEQTPFWFDRVTQDNVMAAAATRVWSETHNLANGRVDETVGSLLFGFLLPKNNNAAALWKLPIGLPGVDRRSFAQNCYVYNGDFSNYPPRGSTLYPPWFNENSQSVWTLAQSWSDPMLCEMYVDLVRKGAGDDRTRSVFFGPSETYGIEDTEMAVIIRDRPFPSPERDKSLLNAPYFRRLPQHHAARGEIADMQLGYSGRERKNAFFFSPAMFAELLAGYQDMQVPLMNRSSFEKHGMRRLDATSRYLAASVINNLVQDENLGERASYDRTLEVLDEQAANFVTMAYAYRRMVRDFHCLNHRLLNGQIRLSRGRPEIRVGSRFIIDGASPEEQVSTYVEGVQHSWDLNTGIRTSLAVTRGWKGTDESYIQALQAEIEDYTKDSDSFPAADAESALPVGDAETVTSPYEGEIEVIDEPTRARVELKPGYIATVNDATASPETLSPLSADQRRSTVTRTPRQGR